jgi:hypothetical protein
MPMRACGQTRIVKNTLDALHLARVAASNTSQIGKQDMVNGHHASGIRRASVHQTPPALTCPCAAKTASLMAGEPVFTTHVSGSDP